MLRKMTILVAAIIAIPFILALFVQNLIENDLSQGLGNLKLLLESDKAINTDVIKSLDEASI
ncbi:hypothetical protein [Shewanella benthica]|uniref:Uncharacterized protein n=1 Tax=Shewanella benthica KT99 TaxID=314608 RepID=A9CVK8_9GAMM|nr:hypothetical protein [Shewanella benthica]EDQ02704.1 hypothetical protein KT99_06047 [Shewanella benthica KT99]